MDSTWKSLEILQLYSTSLTLPAQLAGGTLTAANKVIGCHLYRLSTEGPGIVIVGTALKIVTVVLTVVLDDASRKLVSCRVI
jgi:hypothetical protein